MASVCTLCALWIVNLVTNLVILASVDLQDTPKKEDKAAAKKGNPKPNKKRNTPCHRESLVLFSERRGVRLFMTVSSNLS